MKLAITGGTGFVGSHLVDLAIAAGHAVVALTRSPRETRPGVDWVDGSLTDREALARLVIDSDAVIHVAGVLNAPTRAEFEAGNVTGTLAMLAAATAAGTPRFVHVSSLAAREPQLSMYGASKAQSEKIVERSGLDWAIVRPPAVYGPGDRETLELFRMAKLGLVVLPPAGRLSLIHVDDLARLLLALADPGSPSKLILEPDDGHPAGYTHREFARALGIAVGTRPLALPLPKALLHLGARADQGLRGPRAKLTIDRANYFAHNDWVVDPAKSPPTALWRPEIATAAGLAGTADWYRAHDWL